MADYYNKDKFTGQGGPSGGPGQSGAPGGGYQPPPNQRSYQTPPPNRGPYQAPPPNRPYQAPPNQQSNAGWYSWPVIIVLFALGIWPIALVLLFLNLFGGKKKPTNTREGSAYRYNAQAQSAVERAMRKAEGRVERAETRAERAFDRAGETVDEAVTRAMEQMSRTIDRTARQVERNSQNNWQTPQQQRAQAQTQSQQSKDKKDKAAKQKKKRTKPAGVLLRILGIIFLVTGGIIGLDFLSDIFQGYDIYFDNFFASLGFLGAGGIMFFRGHYLNKMSRRSQRYILAIGNNDVMSLDEIAKRVNRKPAQAEKELQKLIDKGYLGEDAYIDHERGYFLRFGATLEDEEPAETTPPPTPEEAQESYSSILRNIRRANDRIADPVLTKKISRLEQISALIFKEVEEHPEKRSSIHTFFDYYLPTTQKLLDTYADFEETGVEGAHLREAKDRIEQTMDLIVSGFEHQLDQLYSSDAMDVATDIKVMEAMLKRDTATAAQDFGYGEDGGIKLTLDPDDDQKGQGGQMQTM